MDRASAKSKQWYDGWTTLIFCGLFLSGGWLIGHRRQPSDREIIEDFQRWYAANEEKTWRNTLWLGVNVWKTPLDLWIYQEILYETRPDVIVEAGTYKGGSAYFFASIFDLLGRGRILTMDIERFPGQPEHPRITYFIADSTAEATSRLVPSHIRPNEKVMVVLDSKHTKEHVLKEIRLWADLVSIGNYLVVEDTQLNGHPVMPEYGPAAKEAVDEYLLEHSNFEPDRTREKFGLTFQPGGWLKRVQ
jgi:cephalosporin hydroxylase